MTEQAWQKSKLTGLQRLQTCEMAFLLLPDLPLVSACAEHGALCRTAACLLCQPHQAFSIHRELLSSPASCSLQALSAERC